MTVVEVIELKTYEEYFCEIFDGKKLFEMRNIVENPDKIFAKGKILHLRETNRGTGQYTGREIFTDVTYFMQGPIFGLSAGWCLMGLNPKMLRIREVNPTAIKV